MCGVCLYVCMSFVCLILALFCWPCCQERCRTTEVYDRHQRIVPQEAVPDQFACVTAFPLEAALFLSFIALLISLLSDRASCTQTHRSCPLIACHYSSIDAADRELLASISAAQLAYTGDESQGQAQTDLCCRSTLVEYFSEWSVVENDVRCWLLPKNSVVVAVACKQHRQNKNLVKRRYVSSTTQWYSHDRCLPTLFAAASLCKDFLIASLFGNMAASPFATILHVHGGWQRRLQFSDTTQSP